APTSSPWRRKGTPTACRSYAGRAPPGKPLRTGPGQGEGRETAPGVHRGRLVLRHGGGVPHGGRAPPRCRQLPVHPRGPVPGLPDLRVGIEPAAQPAPPPAAGAGGAALFPLRPPGAPPHRVAPDRPDAVEQPRRPSRADAAVPAGDVLLLGHGGVRAAALPHPRGREPAGQESHPDLLPPLL